VDAFIEECAAFPTGKHDDMLDSMSQALNKMNTGLAYGLLGYMEELAADPVALERMRQTAERMDAARFGVVPRVPAMPEGGPQPTGGACPECGSRVVQLVSSGGRRCGMCGEQFNEPGSVSLADIPGNTRATMGRREA
jgi:ribosomal protein L37AE/L43A